jgi:hypothetical protein
MCFYLVTGIRFAGVHPRLPSLLVHGMCGMIFPLNFFAAKARPWAAMI